MKLIAAAAFELAGYALLTAAAWHVHRSLGLAVAGVALIIVSLGIARRCS